MDILKVLDIIEKLELKLSELYDYFHKLFSDNEELSELFLKLSTEEQGHADLVRFQRRIIIKNKNLIKDIEFDLNSINKIISKADSILKSSSKPTIKDALMLAIELENDSGEYHYKNAIKYKDEDFSLLLENLNKHDTDHVEQIKKIANKLEN